jgi:hypothetical protein
MIILLKLLHITCHTLRHGKIDPALLYSIESVIIEWSDLIYKASIKDTDELINENKFARPLDEIEFWKEKTLNLIHIYNQVLKINFIRLLINT